MGEDARAQRAPQRLGAGVGRADADDVGAAPEGLQRDLNGEVLVGLDDLPVLVEVVDQHPPAGVVPLQQVPIADQGGEIRAGRIVADVDQRRVDLVPLPLDLVIDLRGAEQALFLQTVRQGGQVEKARVRAQLPGHQADVLVGLVVPGGDTGVPHQGADVRDGAVPPGILLQPGDELPDEIAPAHAQPPGPNPLEQLHRPLGEGAVGLVLVLPVLHQNAALDGVEGPQPFHQVLPPCSRLVDGDLHHAQLPGLGEHPADQRAGDPQLLRNIALPLVLQIVPAGDIGEFFLLFLAEHGASFLHVSVTYVTLAYLGGHCKAQCRHPASRRQSPQPKPHRREPPFGGAFRVIPPSVLPPA